MPIFEFDETVNARYHNGQRLLEYWGYNTVCFFSPNSSYTAANEYNREGTELKTLIKALHDNGIEVILDVVFNHTAEGNEKVPPSVSKDWTTIFTICLLLTEITTISAAAETR